MSIVCADDTLSILTAFIRNCTQTKNTVDNVMLYYNQIFPASVIQKPLQRNINTINKVLNLIKMCTVLNY